MVDVRTPGEFAAGHAPGSVNIPAGLAEGAKALIRTAGSSFAVRPARSAFARQ
jgi:rhodanese-related sulfurtransferase